MMRPFAQGRHRPVRDFDHARDDLLKALINAAVEICLLRLGPQQLPASSALLALLLLFNLLIGVLMSIATHVGIAIGLLQSLFELVLMLGTLYLALNLTRKHMRFNQTAIALLLSNLLIGVLALPLFSWYQRTAATESGLLLLVLIFWSIVVQGHIIRHAFTVDLNLGIAASVLYTLVSWNLTALLFTVPA
jgi:hypothetical protein